MITNQLKTLKLPKTALSIIRYVDANGERSPSQLQSELGFTKRQVSYALDKLRTAKLIKERLALHKGDTRSILIFINNSTMESTF